LLKEMLFWVFFGAVSIATVLTLVVLLLKKKFGLFLLGFATFGYAWVVGAIRLAKPDSLWAKRFYGIEKMRRSRERSAADR
jgi:hypothetical protein